MLFSFSKMKIQIDELPELPRKTKLRLTKVNYKNKKGIVRWTGTRLIYYCVHNLRISRCKICGGVELCNHDRIRSRCLECKGSEICTHDHLRITCKQCKGSSICKHDRLRSRCKECNGASICTHNCIKSQCKKCFGSEICNHLIQKTKCWKCSAEKTPKNFCKLCKQVYVGNPNYRKYEGYCFSCFCFTFPDKPVTRQIKFKETYLYEQLTKRFPEIQFIRDKIIVGGCSRKKPDFFIDLLTHCIIIENDEFQHQNYGCENRRTMEIYEDLGRRPLVFLRFNPDSYTDEKGNHYSSCFSTNNSSGKLEVDENMFRLRCDELELHIKHYLTNVPEKAITDVKLFYNSTDDEL